MPQQIGSVAFLVRDYDEAIAWFTAKLGFVVVEDTPMANDRRWVMVAPAESRAPLLVLAKASTPDQRARVGDQAGGRVFLFLHTDDFARDHASFVARGVEFLEQPRREPYGSVAVFRDLYGNRWDLLELNRRE